MRSEPTQFALKAHIRALVGQETITAKQEGPARKRKRLREVCSCGDKTTPAPRTPRIEEGTKVVLPDGQVRTIESVAYALDDSPSPSLIGLTVTFTNRWSPRVR